MPNKTIYIHSEKNLCDLLEVLEKRGLKFSTWVNLKITEELKCESFRTAKPGTLWLCDRGKNKIKQANCTVENCPVLDITCGRVAQEREFAAKQPNCLFKKKPSDALAST